MNDLIVVCAYPDNGSYVMWGIREWTYVLPIAFFGVTLFHKQWVLFFFSHWLNLGIILIKGYAKLWDEQVPDPYCTNYNWDAFPSGLCFAVGALSGFAMWYTLLWKRTVKTWPLIYCAALIVVIPTLEVEAKLTAVWQAIVSVLIGIAWSGIYLGGVRIIGPLVWSELQKSTITGKMGFMCDDWSDAPPDNQECNNE